MVIFETQKGAKRLTEPWIPKHFCDEAFFQRKKVESAKNRFFFLIQIFHLGDRKDRPQNGLFTIAELFLNAQKK